MKTIPDLFIARAESTSGDVAAWAPQPEPGDPFYLDLSPAPITPVPGWMPATYGQILLQVSGLARRLQSLGVTRGVPVAIWAPTSDRWTLLDMAIQCLGGITVGVYPTLTDAEVVYQLTHSEAKIVVVDGGDRSVRASSIGTKVASVIQVLSLFRSEQTPQLTPADPDVEWLKEQVERVRVDDVSTYIYTSGTTGVPKAVVLNHHNFTAVVEAARARLPLTPGERSIVFLPLAHVLQRFTQYLGWVDQTEGWFAPSLEDLPATLLTARPHVLATVPRMLEKIRAEVESKATARGPRARAVLDWAVSVGHTVEDMRGRGHPVGWRLKAQHRLADQLVFSRVRAGLGGSLRLLISGGAPLDPALARWFEAMGVTVREGWGLSETTAPATLNGIDDNRFGTVGLPLDGTEVSIAEDGEVLVRGPGVFQGYLKDERATAEAFDDEGFFRTGDLGIIEDRYLRIVGRKKDLIVTSGGKNIAPTPLERALTGGPIASAVVIGDRRPYLVALLVLAEPCSPEGIQAHVTAAMQTFPRHAQIKRWAVLPAAPSEEDGLLTPTLKLRRAALVAQYHQLVDDLYDRATP